MIDHGESWSIMIFGGQSLVDTWLRNWNTASVAVGVQLVYFPTARMMG